MTNLPINTNIAPAQVPGKSAGADDAATQGTQGFGDVLARQVADAAPADKKSDANTTEKKVDTASADATSPAPLASNTLALAPDITNVLPGDMLAALLAQQNQNSAAQPAVNLQLVVNNQNKSDTPEVPVSAVADKDSQAARLLASEKTGLPQAALRALGTQQAALSAAAGQQHAAASAVKDSPSFADALTTLGKNGATLALGNDSPRTINLAAIAAATAQQSGATELAAAQTNTASALRDSATLSGPLTVSTPLTQAGWANDFSQKITWLATQRDQSAELHLNPPHLGPLDVVIKVSADQATAMFTSPHAAVREAIEQALPRLREMLADNGIMLGNATVSDQTSRKDQNDSARSQQGSGTASGSGGEVTSAAATVGRVVTTLPRHNGMVDTFA